VLVVKMGGMVLAYRAAANGPVRLFGTILCMARRAAP
jgi:hypothetical protein